MLAIRAAAAALSAERLGDADLYVTLEPCTMCAAAISFARIRRLYFGAADEKGGAVVSGVRFFASPTCHHAPEIYPGIGETQSAELLTAISSETGAKLARLRATGRGRARLQPLFLRAARLEPAFLLVLVLADLAGRRGRRPAAR